MSNLKEEFKRVNERIKSVEECMATGLMTLAGNTSGSRQMMFFPNLTQYNQLDNPEPPLVTTGYENVFAHYSKISYKDIDRDWVVKDKIVKNKFNYTLILYDAKTDMYDVIKRQEATDLGESYGFRRNNEFIDNLDVDSKIKKGDTLYCSSGYDEEMNYGFGRNLNLIYTMNLNNLEDAITATDDVNLESNKVKIIDAVISDNTIPLNIYGRDGEYRSFPSVGEKVKDCMLFATRQKNEKSNLFNLKNNKLKEATIYDTKYITHGDFKVIDIDIFTNNGLNDLPNVRTHQQIRDLYKDILDYRKELYKALKTIIDSGSNYTTELSYMFKQVKELLDDKIKLSVDDKIFSKYIIQFTVMHKEGITYGSKLVGRYGNKGVIGKIEKEGDYTFFIDEKGEKQKVHIKLDGLGIVARLNSGQSFEQEINWIVAQALDRVWNDQKEFMNTCYKILDILNEEESKEMQGFYDRLNKKEKEVFYESIKRDGLPIFLSPAETVTLEAFEKLIDEFNPKKYRLFKENFKGERIYYNRPMIVGKSYIMFLKHTPLSKFSIRSRGSINPRNSTPTRSNLFLTDKALYSDTANRLGEQETTVLLYCNQPNAVIFLMSIYANSIESRKRLGHYLYNNPLKDGDDFDPGDFRNKTIDIMDNQMGSVGYEFEFEFENPKKYAKRMRDNQKQIDAIKADENKVKNLDQLALKLRREFKEE